MSDIQVRPLMPSDAPRVAELARELGYDVTPNDASLRIAGLEARSECAYVAVSDGTVVAWIHAVDRRLLQEPAVLEIGGLVVAEPSRGIGIGQRLVEAVNRWGRRRGHNRLLVRSNLTRLDAHGFYEGLGFANDKTTHTFSRSID